jgi:DhnA family fructose-bisphosphate aldolase class Ia
MGFEDPRATLSKVLEGCPDGVLITPNFARRFQGILSSIPDLKLIIRVDFFATSTVPGETGTEIQCLLSDVEEAMRVGADGIAAFLIFGREDPRDFSANIGYIAALSKETHRCGIPLVIETVFWGRRTSVVAPEREAELLEAACRIAFEIGADVIKAPYPRDRTWFSRITKNSPIPILVLGGPRMDTAREALEMVRDALEGGAQGVIFGRNIWQHKSPDKMVKAIKAIVHRGSSVDDALELLK